MCVCVCFSLIGCLYVRFFFRVWNCECILVCLLMYTCTCVCVCVCVCVEITATVFVDVLAFITLSSLGLREKWVVCCAISFWFRLLVHLCCCEYLCVRGDVFLLSFFCGGAST